KTLAVLLTWELEPPGLPTGGVEERHRVAGRARAVPAVGAVGADEAAGHRVALEPLHDLPELERLRVAGLEQALDQPAQAQVLAVEHLEVQVREDVRERPVAQRVALDVQR